MRRIIAVVVAAAVVLLTGCSTPSEPISGHSARSPVPTATKKAATPKATKSAATKKAVASPKCVIKGNISTNTGERIYHVPGQEYYDMTVIREAYGERWFCTEAEARAAGWRKSKQ